MRIIKYREMARADAFEDIDVFYNRSHRLSHLGGISTEESEPATV